MTARRATAQRRPAPDEEDPPRSSPDVSRAPSHRRFSRSSAAIRRGLHILGRDDKGEAVAWAGVLPRPGGEVLGGWVLGHLDATAKRVVDLGLSGLGLLFAWPIWLVIAAAIKLEDGGPVFFRHERVGRHGRLFTALKFRSMVPPENGARAAQQGTPPAELITRVGRFMRATALDELPQLWNIFRGDMSFVGPRAVPPFEKAGDGSGEAVDVSTLPGFVERHLVRPGLTGLAQVYLRRDATHLQKFRFDLLYVRTRSFRLDLELIARSVLISLLGKWPEIGRKGD